MEFSVFIIGLIFGSFLNVLIYRLPLSISLLTPSRSFCPSCKNKIKWYENIPILSYSILKGRCPNCDKSISIFYPLVELLTASITVLIFIRMGLSLDFLVITILFYTLIVLSFIDLKYKAVPDYMLIIALLISIIYSEFNFQTALIFAGAFTLLELFITYYIQNIKYKITKDANLLSQRSLGEGDIPIVAIIGGILGLKFGLMAIVLAAFLAIIPSIYNTVSNKEIETPFIPFLSMGLFLIFYFDYTLGALL